MTEKIVGVTTYDANLEHLILGQSRAIRRIRALIEKVAPTNVPILIQGPTGVGKELVAQALHRLSGRTGRLVAFNVCAVAESLFEATLFGHVRGAFTGALSDSPGYLLEADRGTAFMDEVSGLSGAAQAKLLRALETREFRPVGGRADRRSDFRLLAASNEDVWRLVAEDRFRADLAERLAGVSVRVPPLAERMEDVPVLAAHFAAQERAALADSALRALMEHHWPRNVRELRHVVARAALLSERPTIDARAVQDAIDSPVARGEARSANGSTRHEHEQFARRRLETLMEECGWDTALAAEQLRVNRATVYRRLQRFGVQLPADVRAAMPRSAADREGTQPAGETRGPEQA